MVSCYFWHMENPANCQKNTINLAEKLTFIPFNDRHQLSRKKKNLISNAN